VPTGGAAYASPIPALLPEPAYLPNPTAAALVLTVVVAPWMWARVRRCQRDLRAAAPPTAPHHPLLHFISVDRALPPEPHVVAAAPWIDSSPPPPVLAPAPWMPHSAAAPLTQVTGAFSPPSPLPTSGSTRRLPSRLLLHMQVALPTVVDLRPLLPVPISSSRCRKAGVREIGHCQGGACRC
jgi:hypothetical protein